MDELNITNHLTEDEEALYYDMLGEYFTSDSDAVDCALEFAITELVNRAACRRMDAIERKI